MPIAAMAPMAMGTKIGLGLQGAGMGMKFMESRKQRKQQKSEARKQRQERRLAGIRDTYATGQAQKQAAIGMLSQAAFDWASSLSR